MKTCLTCWVVWTGKKWLLSTQGIYKECSRNDATHMGCGSTEAVYEEVVLTLNDEK